MTMPDNILSIVEKINQSEDIWKVPYMAIWPFRQELLKLKGTPDGEKECLFRLPASRKGSHSYSPKKLCSIIPDLDPELKMIHLVVLFSLFESIPYKNRKSILLPKEMKELELAKETRNCYIHNVSKADDRWIVAYKKARGEPTIKEGEDISNGFTNLFHEIEDWHKLIVKTANKIKIKIENKK